MILQKLLSIPLLSVLVSIDNYLQIAVTLFSNLKSFAFLVINLSFIVYVNDKSYIYSKVSNGVTQGSVLGAVMIFLCMLSLAKIIRKHSINFH